MNFKGNEMDFSNVKTSVTFFPSSDSIICLEIWIIWSYSVFRTLKLDSQCEIMSLKLGSYTQSVNKV